MKTGKSILLAVMVLILIGGVAYALYPVYTGYFLSHEYVSEARDFLRRATPAATAPASDDPTPYPDLYAAMQEYNAQIYREAQEGLCDPWAYQDPSFDLAEYGIENEAIGVISIPAVNVEMPIYLGATGDNMAKGAVHLSQTSLPIGGANTNCVIAGHRGWKGAAYFLRVPELAAGDEITITNLWETLTYTVTAAAVIEPSDIEAIRIQPDKDMLTLITCHPYGSGGRYRYVVYCERTEGA